ncbi:MAG: hypothetical protein GY730_08345 [bacterium]|nr:hypothetical protein [bacterium]
MICFKKKHKRIFRYLIAALLFQLFSSTLSGVNLNLSKDQTIDILNSKGITNKKLHNKVKAVVEKKSKNSLKNNKNIQVLKNKEKTVDIQSKIEKLFFMMPNFEEDEDIKRNLFKSKPYKIESYASEKVKQFGYSMFSRPVNVDQAPHNIPVNDNYVLGPGDSINVYLWGKVEDHVELTVDRQGKVIFPKIGQIYLSGLKFKDVKRVIKDKLNKMFVNFDLTITLGKLRSVRVYILGDVQTPGAYNISSLSTVFNALYIAGGPTKMGTLRNIKFIKNGKIISKIDLYKYLIKGNMKHDPTLEEDCTIFVPPIGNVVKISGLVKRPAIYEIKDNTTIDDLVKLAGGLTIRTYYKRMQVLRVENGEYMKVMDLAFKDYKGLKKKIKKTKIKNGDQVYVFPITNTIRNYVTVKGNISRAGDYELTEKFTLRELIEQAEGILPGTYKERVDIFRFSDTGEREIIPVNLREEPSFELAEWDYIRIYSKKDIYGIKEVSINGAVKKSGKYNLYENMRLSDLIFLAKPDDFAELKQVEIHRRLLSGEQEKVEINYEDIMKYKGSEKNITLKPMDEVYIKRKKAPRIKAVISGEVKYPGTYVITEGERISSLIERAGGYTKEAFLQGAVFTRKYQEGQRAVQDQTLIRDEEKKLIYEQKLVGRLPENIDINNKILDAQKKSLDILRKQMDNVKNRIIISLEKINDRKKSEYNLKIKHGDRLNIPSTPATVRVIGGVQSPSTMLYISGRKIDYYLEKAGGFTPYAEIDRVFVFKSDGSVKRNVKDIDLGDLVYVPERVIVPFDIMMAIKETLSVFKTISEGIISIVVINTFVNSL